MDRSLSANLFNEWWNNGNKPDLKEQNNPISNTNTNTNTIDNQPTKDLFEFISQEHSPNFDLGLFSLLPQAQGEDYEEEQFANRNEEEREKILNIVNFCVAYSRFSVTRKIDLVTSLFLESKNFVYN